MCKINIRTTKNYGEKEMKWFDKAREGFCGVKKYSVVCVIYDVEHMQFKTNHNGIHLAAIKLFQMVSLMALFLKKIIQIRNILQISHYLCVAYKVSSHSSIPFCFPWLDNYSFIKTIYHYLTLEILLKLPLIYSHPAIFLIRNINFRFTFKHKI